MSNYDPSGTGSYHSGLFGIPSSPDSARIVLIPVPWEVTTSYGGGTSRGPQAVLEASAQLDLFDFELGRSYEKGYHLLPIPTDLLALNDKMKPMALQLRNELESQGQLSTTSHKTLGEINSACAKMCGWVRLESQKILAKGQIPAVLGGDHSSPEGNIQAVSESLKGEFGILHLDAHADLRSAYQGFERSHASIFHNVMHAPWRPKKLVQVAIRDFSEEEHDLSQKRADIKTFFDTELKRQMFEGATWADCCRRIVEELPRAVYLSFDIDGLSPEFCPGTGTPVPGGLTYDQAVYLMRSVVHSGRRIVGFDLNEVAQREGTEWDGNVGARMLYKMCGWTILSER